MVIPMRDLLVLPAKTSPTFGELHFGGKAYRCALGRSGVTKTSEKKEGDGATPAGTHALRELWYRADRLPRPTCALRIREIHPNDGWCDDPGHPSYNTHVRLPFPAGHETLWREDEAYDLIVPLGYNDDPVIPGKGSAIFLHVAKTGYAPTAGCVALKRHDLLEILASIDPDTRMAILEA